MASKLFNTIMNGFKEIAEYKGDYELANKIEADRVSLDESLDEAVKPFVDDSTMNLIRRYEMYHLPTGYRYADVDSARRLDAIGGETPDDMYDLIEATICRITDDGEEDYSEHQYKVYNNGKVKEVSNESLDEDKNETLNPAIWDSNGEMIPEVKEKLKEIANKFIDQLENEEIPLDVEDIIVVGSNANYNYTQHSDVDLHIVADLSQFKGREKELVEKLYQAKKSLFNDKYDPVIKGFDVEIYVEPSEDKNENDIPDDLEESIDEFGYEYESPGFVCKKCGSELEFLGYQGYLEEYICTNPECNTYHYLTRDGELLTGDELS